MKLVKEMLEIGEHDPHIACIANFCSGQIDEGYDGVKSSAYDRNYRIFITNHMNGFISGVLYQAYFYDKFTDAIYLHVLVNYLKEHLKSRRDYILIEFSSRIKAAKEAQHVEKLEGYKANLLTYLSDLENNIDMVNTVLHSDDIRLFDFKKRCVRRKSRFTVHDDPTDDEISGQTLVRPSEVTENPFDL